MSGADRLVFWLLRATHRHQRWLVAALFGFLLGRIVGSLVVRGAGAQGILTGIFSPTQHPANVLSWLLLALLALALVSRPVLTTVHRRRNPETILTSLLRHHGVESSADFQGPGWGDAVSLQTCPMLHLGWPASGVQLQHSTQPFPLPEAHSTAYREYRERNFQAQRFFDDRLKVMLVSNPIAFSDSPTLVLQTQETLYSVVQFYHQHVAADAAERTALMQGLAKGSVQFPHSLCMHAIVVTRDDQVLLTKRSEKVSYHPGTWSCSLEEQLATQDLAAGPSRTVLQWCQRLLREELGLGSGMYHDDNLRILSIFLESAELNISLCAHVVLEITSSELQRSLHWLPRADYEFTDWNFLRHKELMDELVRPTRAYHPTSGYRMLMALIHRYGEPGMAARLSPRAVRPAGGAHRTRSFA